MAEGARERFAMAAMRSRQQVMTFERALRRAGIPAQIMTTPRSVSTGCGLSVRFPLEDARRAGEIYRAAPAGNLIGFYEVSRSAAGQPQVKPLGIRTGYSG